MSTRTPPLTCVASVSGIRGIIGDDLNPDQVLYLAAAFGSAIAGGGRVVVGRDSRATGAALAQAVMAGLRGVGCSVIEVGVVPTPTVALAVAHHRASGGIQVSASHNNNEWNALKFFSAAARNIDNDQLEWVLNAYADPPLGMWKRWDSYGDHQHDAQAVNRHLDTVVAAVDATAIRAAGLRVVIDCVNGAGSVAGPELLRRLGCDVTVMDGCPDQPFPRDPEPTVANTARTAAVVKALKAQVGFIQDPDADRLAVIDGNGTYLGEEYTLALCADARLAAARAAGQSAVVVTNLSTSRMLDDIAAAHGARVVRTRVGEAHVVGGLISHNAAIAGEGNGGVIDPRVVVCRDSHIAMALILERMATSGRDVAGLVAAIPRYQICKAKVQMERKDLLDAFTRILNAPTAAGAQIDRQDGMKLVWPDRWVSLRASGTEPVARIIAEAPSLSEATALVTGIAAIADVELLESH